MLRKIEFKPCCQHLWLKVKPPQRRISLNLHYHAGPSLYPTREIALNSRPRRHAPLVKTPGLKCLFLQNDLILWRWDIKITLTRLSDLLFMILKATFVIYYFIFSLEIYQRKDLVRIYIVAKGRCLVWRCNKEKLSMHVSQKSKESELQHPQIIVYWRISKNETNQTNFSTLLVVSEKDAVPSVSLSNFFFNFSCKVHKTGLVFQTEYKVISKDSAAQKGQDWKRGCPTLILTPLCPDTLTFRKPAAEVDKRRCLVPKRDVSQSQLKWALSGL